jgi:nitrilase
LITDIEFMHDYMANSLRADSEEMLRIRLACRDNKITAVLGYSERDGASLFISQTIIGPDGDVLLHRRKIKPTAMERTVFGDGQGDSLMNVAQTPVGKVACLSCAEHIGPLAKFHEYSLGAQIHVAAWPAIFPSEHGGGHFSFGGPAAQMFTRCLAMEGQCFAVMSTQLISEAGAERMQVAGAPLVQAPS